MRLRTRPPLLTYLLTCCGASSAPWRFGLVAAGVESPVVYGPSWSGGWCPCPGPVTLRPARGGVCWGGCPPTPCAGLWSGAGSLGRVSVACCPPGSGPAADPGGEVADEVAAPSDALWGSV